MEDPVIVFLECMPGNVTARFAPPSFPGTGFKWVPPKIVKIRGKNFVDVAQYFSLEDIEGIDLSKEKYFMEIKNSLYPHILLDDILICKIKKVYLENFSNLNDKYSNIWCWDGVNVVPTTRGCSKIKDDTSSFPLLIKYVTISDNMEGKLGQIPMSLRGVVKEIRFYDNYNNYFTIYKGAYAVQVVLKLSGGDKVEFTGGLVKNGMPVIMGYQMTRVEGLETKLSKIDRFLKSLSPSLLFHLKLKFAMHEIALELVKEGYSRFDIDKITKILTTYTSVEQLAKYSDKDVIESIHLHKVNKSRRDELRNLAERYIDEFKNNMTNPPEEKFKDYLKYTFAHSLSHAILGAFVSTGGIGDENADEHITFNDQPTIYTYELPTVGATRIVSRNFISSKELGTVDFEYYLDDIIFNCHIGDVEEYIYNILFQLKKDTINIIKDIIREGKITSTQEFAHITVNFGVPPPPSFSSLIEKLYKIFKNEEEFNLYYSIFVISQFLKKIFKREPLIEELTWFANLLVDSEDLRNNIIKHCSNLLVEDSLEKLVDYAKKVSPKILNEELKKRYLNTCIDGCPACIGQKCYENPVSQYTLSRKLLRETILKSLEEKGLLIKNIKDYKDIIEKMKVCNFLFLIIEPNELQSIMELSEKVWLRDIRVIQYEEKFRYLILLMRDESR